MSFIRKEDAPALAIANIDTYFCNKDTSGVTAPTQTIPHHTEAASGGTGDNASATAATAGGSTPDEADAASESFEAAAPPPLAANHPATAALLPPAALLSRSQSMPASAPRHTVRRGQSERLDHARLPYILEHAQARTSSSSG